MKHSVPHSLDRAEARALTHKALDSYGEKLAKHAPEAQWLDENTVRATFDVAGKRLVATLSICEGSMDVDCPLPLAFRPFQSAVRTVLDREIGGWLNRGGEE